jgi:hypothetical protein
MKAEGESAVQIMYFVLIIFWWRNIWKERTWKLVEAIEHNDTI